MKAVVTRRLPKELISPYGWAMGFAGLATELSGAR